jgi:hypothetical protein
VLSRSSPTLAMPPALFALVIFETGSYFCPGQPGLDSSYFTHPTVAGITGTCHQLLVKMGSCKFFLPRLASNSNPPDLSLVSN